MHVEHQPTHAAAGLHIGLAISGYHRDITDALCAGAKDAYTEAGGRLDDLVIVAAPGTFELPIVAQRLARRADVEGVVALGCVIRGETTHDQYISQAVAHGLTEIALETAKPVAFGVLTCQTRHQARERAGGEHGNKGREAMAAVIETIHALRALDGHRSRQRQDA